jgi:hypothetical protein
MNKKSKFKSIELKTVENLKKLWDAFVLLKQNGRIAIPDYLSEGILAHFLGAERIEGNGDLLLNDHVIEQKSSTSEKDGPSTFSRLFHSNTSVMFVQFHPSLDGRFDVYDIPNNLIMEIIDPQKERGLTAFKVQMKKLIKDNNLFPTHKNVTIFS